MRGRIRRMIREHAMTHGINSATFKTTNARKPVQHLLNTQGIANVLGFPEADVIAVVNQMEAPLPAPQAGATINVVETLTTGVGSSLTAEKILAPPHAVPSSID